MDGADRSLALLVSVALAALTGGGLMRIADAGVQAGDVSVRARGADARSGPTAPSAAATLDPFALVALDAPLARAATDLSLSASDSARDGAPPAAARLDAAGVAGLVHALEVEHARATRAELEGLLERELAGLPEAFWAPHDQRLASGEFQVVTTNAPWRPTTPRERRLATLRPYGLERIIRLEDGRRARTQVSLEDLRPHGARAVEIGWLQSKVAR